MGIDEVADIVMAMGANPVLYSATAPSWGSLDPYSSPSHSVDDALWLCFENPDGWQRVMAAMDSGQDPAGVTYDDDVVHYAGQPQDTWSQGPVAPADMEGDLPESEATPTDGSE